MGLTIHTIGHSIHDSDRFFAMLEKHGISAVCDVRSRPYSRRSPHFGREPLEAALAAQGIAYVFLGDLLGGRSSDPACYDGERVDYRRVAATNEFRQGIERLWKGIRRYRVALMCAEGEPLACHRTLLVCRHLREPELSIRHILPDGSAEPHELTERRLLTLAGIRPVGLFDDSSELLERAYDVHGLEIAYSGASPTAAKAR